MNRRELLKSAIAGILTVFLPLPEVPEKEPEVVVERVGPSPISQVLRTISLVDYATCMRFRITPEEFYSLPVDDRAQMRKYGRVMTDIRTVEEVLAR